MHYGIVLDTNMEDDLPLCSQSIYIDNKHSIKLHVAQKVASTNWQETFK